MVLSVVSGRHCEFLMYDIVRGASVLQEGEVYEMTGKTAAGRREAKEMSDGTMQCISQ